jgi:hypothetical protein
MLVASTPPMAARKDVFVGAVNDTATEREQDVPPNERMLWWASAKLMAQMMGWVPGLPNVMLTCNQREALCVTTCFRSIR